MFSFHVDLVAKENLIFLKSHDLTGVVCGQAGQPFH